MTRYAQSPKPVNFVCGNCKNHMSFSPSLPIASDSYGYYYLITPSSEYSKLQVLDILLKEFSQTIEDRNLLDVISVKCVRCGKYSSFAIATAVIAQCDKGNVDKVLSLKDNHDVFKLPIVLLQRLSDESFLPLCLMDSFIDKGY